MSFIVGITGGIGAGKTTVLAGLAKQGWQTLDSDQVVHDLYRTDDDLRTILRQRWGDATFTADGSLDRPAVARIVFAQAQERQWLEAQVHPRVLACMRNRAATRPPPLFCAIPLLFEAGWQASVAASVAVWCSATVQARRLAERGWSQAERQRRIEAQMSMDEKLELADYGIINNGDRDLLSTQLEQLTETIQKTITTAATTHQGEHQQ